MVIIVLLLLWLQCVSKCFLHSLFPKSDVANFVIVFVATLKQMSICTNFLKRRRIANLWSRKYVSSYVIQICVHHRLLRGVD